jgi:hypothetical protein
VSQLTELSIPRNMSTPARVSLRAEHLPPPAREALAVLQQAIAGKAAAETAFANATSRDKAVAQQAVGTATEAVHAALSGLADVTASSTTAIRDSANAAFITSMAAASGAVRTAVDALAEATDAAALYATAKPGRPVLRLDGRGPTDAPVRARLGLLRSQLRDLLSLLPDDIDN